MPTERLILDYVTLTKPEYRPPWWIYVIGFMTGGACVLGFLLLLWVLITGDSSLLGF